MDDNAMYIELLEQTGRLTAPAVRACLEDLDLAPGTRGADIGCGIGTDVERLCEIVGPDGHVTGVDIEPEFVSLAQRHLVRTNPPCSWQVVRGSATDLDFPDGSLDWVTSRDTFWGSLFDPEPVLADIHRILRPGGRVALLFWTDHVLLPGYNRLEARLDVGFAEEAPYHEFEDRDRHHSRALGWLGRAGFEDLAALPRTTAIQGPLSRTLQGDLVATLHMLWDMARPHVTDEEWSTFESLVDPESPDYLPARPDYVGLVTYVAFTGRKPG